MLHHFVHNCATNTQAAQHRNTNYVYGRC